MSPNRQANVIYPINEIQIVGKKPEIDETNTLLEISLNNDDDKSKNQKINLL